MAPPFVGNASNPNINPLHTVAHVQMPATAMQFKTHRGPLPAADELKSYADIDPKVLDLILEMARKNNDTQNVTARRNQVFTFIGDLSKTSAGLIFGGGCILTSYALAMHNHEYIALALATTTVTIGLGVLVNRAVSNKDTKLPQTEAKPDSPPASDDTPS